MKKKRRRVPVTDVAKNKKTLRHGPPPNIRVESTAAASHKQQKRTQLLINTIHTLNKRLEAAQRQGDSAAADDIQRQINGLGGLDAYQKASLKGGDERIGRGACGRWLVANFLQEWAESELGVKLTGGRKKRRKEGSADGSTTAASSSQQQPMRQGCSGRMEIVEDAKTTLKLLDVGAVSGETYDHWRWIDPVYIDLNPQKPNVIKQDFFERPPPTDQDSKFHVVCLSLVVNFVGLPDRRGDMLVHARRFILPSGILYLVLPLPCVTNSRYLTVDRLKDLMLHIGFQEIKQHCTSRLIHLVYRRTDDDHDSPPSANRKKAFPKVEVNPGGSRNNFCIVV